MKSWVLWCVMIVISGVFFIDRQVELQQQKEIEMVIHEAKKSMQYIEKNQKYPIKETVDRGVAEAVLIRYKPQ